MKLNALKRRNIRPDESGIAVLLALMMGLVLSAGASALLINQLYAKRLSSSESYQQISEAAAINGFNRILALLNSQDEETYRGFLFTLDNQENTSAPNNGYSWLNLKNNQELNLEESTIGNEGGKAIGAALEKNTTLKELNFSGMQMPRPA